MKISHYLFFALITIGSLGCITKTHHVKIDPVSIEADFAPAEANTKIDDKIIEAFLGSGSLAGQIVAGSVSYRIKEGRWPKSAEELIYGLHLIKPDANLLEKNLDLQFLETDTEILTISYAASSGENGTLTLNPEETNQLNQVIDSTPISDSH